MTARIVLLVTSPRLPAELLTAAAWDLLRANPVYAAAESEQGDALRSAGVEITVIEPDPQRLIAALADHETIVWLSGPAGDQEFARQLGLRLAREPSLAELELAYGSWDPPGARLLDAVAVMDRLASPGGDPWKQQQTHETLAKYLLEESYEAYDAIVAGDLESLREELGDVLLQVVLHARLAENLPEDERWTVDDVAAGLVDKMVRRNPHVFAGEKVTTVDEITDNWERIKRAEKARDSVLDGIALSQPALSLSAKILQRATRAGLSVPLVAAPEPAPGVATASPQAPAAASAVESDPDPAAGSSRAERPVPLPFPSAAPPSTSPLSPFPSGSGSPSSSSSPGSPPPGSDEAELGALLLGIVAEAQATGLDAEAALRRAALEFAERVRAAEREIVGPSE